LIGKRIFRLLWLFAPLRAVMVERPTMKSQAEKAGNEAKEGESKKSVTQSEPTAKADSEVIGALPQPPEFIALVFQSKKRHGRTAPPL